ncbi:MAG: F0F1 ATP synthase subunit B [Chloroflexota bacterium]
MQIDWFTVAAQIVNFIILLYLLKRFLYGPIIEAMDRREQKIADRLQQAETQRQEAEAQAKRYRQQQQELEDQRQEKLAAMQEEISKRRKALLNEAEQEIRQKKENWQEMLRREQEAFVREFRQRIGYEAGQIARRALEDLAGVTVEARMAEQFVDRLAQLGPGEKDDISQALQDAGGALTVRSAFDLPEDARRGIGEAVRTHVLDGGGVALHPRFETAPHLISGVEMRVHGRQIAWTVDDYLSDLEAKIRETIAERAGTEEETVHGG